MMELHVIKSIYRNIHLFYVKKNKSNNYNRLMLNILKKKLFANKTAESSSDSSDFKCM